MRGFGVFLVASGMALAGCINGTHPALEPPADGTNPANAVTSMAAFFEGLPCEVDNVDVVGMSNNMATIAVNPLAPLGGAEEANHGDADVHGGILLSARLGVGGFEVVDISDPAGPTVVATFADGSGNALDVKFSSDGTTAFIGTQGGIDIVDVRDPAAPVKTAVWTPQDLQILYESHRLHVYDIGGTDYLFLVPNANNGVWILKITGEAGERGLEFVTRAGDFPLGGGFIGPHDVWVGHDEDLDTPVLYIANGFKGWLAYDVADPASPDLLGGALPADPFAAGYLDAIQAATLDGRRLVATVSEVGLNAVKVYDATNLMAPVLVGEWTLAANDATSRQHSLQIVDGDLYVAHDGHGVFVFDLGQLPTVPGPGTFMLEPIAHYDVGDGSAWDVVLKDGIVYVNDWGQGLHAVAFGCLEPGVAELTSTG